MKEFSVENFAFDLALEFRKYYKKYTYKVYRIDNIKTSKWWPHFIKTAEKYKDYPEFDLKFFIQIQFEKYGKVMPYFLPGKKAEETYKQNYYKENSIEEKIISEVKGSKDAIINWSNKFKQPYCEYFDGSNHFYLANKVGYVSPYYLCFSKSFLSTYATLTKEQREQVYSKKDLSLKRAFVNQHPDTKKEVEKILKEDFI